MQVGGAIVVRPARGRDHARHSASAFSSDFAVRLLSAHPRIERAAEHLPSPRLRAAANDEVERHLDARRSEQLT